MRFVLVLCISLATTLACGSGAAGDDDDDDIAGVDGGEATGRYFPIDVGAAWTYRVVDNLGSTGTKIQTVVTLEDVGGDKAGVTAYRLETSKPSAKRTVSWQEDTGTALIRHREQTFAADQTQETDEIYAPGKLRLDESPDHVATGAVFSETYDERITDFTLSGATTTITKTEQWTVVAVDVDVTVPAGTFSCIELRRVNAATGSDKSYWFSRGVGKVREVGAGQTEELMAYTLP